jgi:hypothetical protein
MNQVTTIFWPEKFYLFSYSIKSASQILYLLPNAAFLYHSENESKYLELVFIDIEDKHRNVCIRHFQ